MIAHQFYLVRGYAADADASGRWGVPGRWLAAVCLTEADAEALARKLQDQSDDAMLALAKRHATSWGAYEDRLAVRDERIAAGLLADASWTYESGACPEYSIVRRSDDPSEREVNVLNLHTRHAWCGSRGT